MGKTKKKLSVILGIIGPLLAYVSIGISITLSPWFSWESNALSDLGHSFKSDVAPIFNLGLLTTGFLTTIYAVTTLKDHLKYTSILLTASAFTLQMIACFDEIYGVIHYAVSVLFFILLGASTLAYSVENRSTISMAAFLVID